MIKLIQTNVQYVLLVAKSFHGVIVSVYEIFDLLNVHFFVRVDVPHNKAMTSKCNKQEVA